MKGRKCFGQQMFGAALSPFAFFGVAFPGSAEAETTYIVTQYSYDAAGRLECTAVRMNPAVFGSLPSSACTLGVQGDAEPDRITKNSYDAAGQLIQVRKAVGTSLETVEATYAYSPNGKQTDVIDANGNHAQFTYDGFDRLKQWLFPSAGLPKDRPAAFNPTSVESAFSTAGPVNGGDYEEYDYDNNGNRTYFRKRDGSTLIYTYDALSRMTSKLVPGRSGLPTTNTRSVYYSYDLQNHQTDARFDNAAGEGVSNAFDALGRQTSTSLIMDNVTRTASLEYDADGNRTRMTYPDGNYVTYSYDGLDRPLAIARSGSSTIASYGYDAAGRRNSFNSGINTGYDYDSIGRLKSLSNTPNRNGSYANTYGFNYNPASQLTSLSKSNNLFVFKGAYNVNRGYEVNGLNQYHTAGAASFDYDPNGNLKSDASTTFMYDIENRLVSADGAHKVQLRYDPLGRLYEIAGSTGTMHFFYNGDELIGEYDGGGNLLRRYVHGADLKSDDPIAWYEGSGFNGATERFLRPDWQGSIALVTDSAGGSVYAANTFDEYGIPGTGNTGRFQYTGQAWIPELGMYYYKARFYSPTLGRFMQTDPIGYKDQINLYAYVANDPVSKIDFNGQATTMITEYNSLGVGYHSAWIITRNGDTTIYDPAGSYGHDHNWGSGDLGSSSGGDQGVSMQAYVSDALKDGYSVRMQTLKTTVAEEKKMIDNAADQGGGFAGECTSQVCGTLDDAGRMGQIQPSRTSGTFPGRFSETIANQRNVPIAQDKTISPGGKVTDNLAPPPPAPDPCRGGSHAMVC